MIRYKRKRSVRVWYYDTWNMDVESGDLMVCQHTGKLYRLETPSSWPKRTRGELYPRLIEPPFFNAKAIRRDDEVYWIEESFFHSK